MNNAALNPSPDYRRNYRRYNCDRRILVSYREHDRERYLHGRCTIISEGGFGAVVDGQLHTDQIVDIEFAVQNVPVPLRLAAKVRYNSGFDHGFEFVAPDSRQRNVISEFFKEGLAASS